MGRDDRLSSELDQLKAAVRDKNGAEAARIVGRIRAVDPQAADQIVTGGIAAGLRRLTGRS